MCFDSDITIPRLAALRNRYQADLDRALKNDHEKNSARWVEFNTNRLNELPRPMCANCVHLQTGMRCRLAGAVPPLEVRENGCEAWEFDDIPF